MFKRKKIYLDYASMTPIDKRVLREMQIYSSSKYSNPSSWYKSGVNAKNVLEESRQVIARYINSHSDEIVFTSGGTESNNLAILGVINQLRGQNVDYRDMHIIVSAIEHSSVIEIARHLAIQGVRVDYLPVDQNGIVKIDMLKQLLKKDTVLVSIMTVNNEVGTIQPIKDLLKIVRQSREGNIHSKEEKKYPIFHTDAAQAIYSKILVDKVGIDLMTLDSQKMYGPRGVGLLYVKRNTPIQSIIYGGGQESGLRSGTENLPQIVGFKKAIELLIDDSQRIQSLKDFMIHGLKEIFPEIKINGDISNSSPHILNVSIPNIDNEYLLFQLDAKGIEISTKSSCLRDEDESYVLKAMNGVSDGAVRFSFGRWTTINELKRVLIQFKKIINRT
jgi:cysteine desulfurase